MKKQSPIMLDAPTLLMILDQLNILGQFEGLPWDIKVSIDRLNVEIQGRMEQRVANISDAELYRQHLILIRSVALAISHFHLDDYHNVDVRSLLNKPNTIKQWFQRLGLALLGQGDRLALERLQANTKLPIEARISKETNRVRLGIYLRIHQYLEMTQSADLDIHFIEHWGNRNLDFLIASQGALRLMPYQFHLLINACPDLNIWWLIFGYGSMSNQKAKSEYEAFQVRQEAAIQKHLNTARDQGDDEEIERLTLEVRNEEMQFLEGMNDRLQVIMELLLAPSHVPEMSLIWRRQTLKEST